MKIIVFIALLFTATLCHAVGEGPPAIEVRVELGTSDGKQIFVPDHLEFERGHQYKLVLHNPSDEDHYFTSEAFVTRIHTHKVEVAGESGKTLVEVHGDVHDLELKPGTTIEWLFYPMRNGENMKLYCHKRDHEEHGMVGTITIKGPPPFSK